MKVKTYPKLGLVFLAYVAFIALGMPDGLLGVGWPSIRASFSLPIDAIGMLITASVAGYMTSSFLSGPLLSRLGVGRLLAGSCALTGLGLIGYTLAPAWWVMVLLGIIAGLGVAFLVEFLEPGLRGYRAVCEVTGLMPLVVVPYIQSPSEFEEHIARQNRMIKIIVWTAFVFVMMAVVFMSFTLFEIKQA